MPRTEEHLSRYNDCMVINSNYWYFWVIKAQFPAESYLYQHTIQITVLLWRLFKSFTKRLVANAKHFWWWWHAHEKHKMPTLGDHLGSPLVFLWGPICWCFLNFSVVYFVSFVFALCLVPNIDPSVFSNVSFYHYICMILCQGNVVLIIETR